MPMDADALGALMKANVDALSDEAKADRSQTYKALAAAVIQHIQTAAQISGACTGLTSAPGGGPVVGVAVLPPGSIL